MLIEMYWAINSLAYFMILTLQSIKFPVSVTVTITETVTRDLTKASRSFAIFAVAVAWLSLKRVTWKAYEQVELLHS